MEVYIDRLPDHLVESIFERLPAKSLAFVTTVRRSWHPLARAILSRPNLASAISVNPSPLDAVREVIDSISSRPFRPQFIILCVSRFIHPAMVEGLIHQVFGFNTPIVIYNPAGIIGDHSISAEVMQVNWLPHHIGPTLFNHDHDDNLPSLGMCLIAGNLPGLVVEAVPSFFFEMGIHVVGRIKNFATDASGCKRDPDAVMIIGGLFTNTILHKIGANFPKTIICGGERGNLRYKGKKDSHFSGRPSIDLVALVFARDKNTPRDVARVRIDAALATGLLPVGPTFKVANKIEREGHVAISAVHGDGLVVPAGDIMEIIDTNDKYAEFTGTRYFRQGTWPRNVSEYHKIIGPDPEDPHLLGIEPNFICTIAEHDTFRLHRPDTDTSRSSFNRVSEAFRQLLRRERWRVFGAVVFSCACLDNTFLDDENVVCTTFSQHFPRLPIAGVYSHGEAGRVAAEEGAKRDQTIRLLHRYGTSYMIFSYMSPRLP